MSTSKLKRLLAKKRDVISLVNDLETSRDVLGIRDATGTMLYGTAAPDAIQHPILSGNEIVGWVIGNEAAAVVARLLTRLANKEAENTALTDDTLELYREINLLYSLSEKLTSSLEVVTLGQIVL